MPRTKLDKRRPSKAEQDAYIIRRAMANNRIYTDVELAGLIDTSGPYLSRCFKNGFSPNMKVRLCSVLNFSEEDFRALMGVRL